MRTYRVLFVAALLLTAFSAANAQPTDVEVGRGMICDTEEQVVSYLEVRETVEDVQAALTVVNKPYTTSNACAIVPVIYRRGETMRTVTTSFGTYHVVRITVVGFLVGQGAIQAEPTVQYTMFGAPPKPEPTGQKT